MSDLVPEKRLNRLGRLVTKWVRRDKGELDRAAQLKEVLPTIPSSSGLSAIELAKDAKERDVLGAELLAVLKSDMAKRVAGRTESHRDPEAEDKAVTKVLDQVMGMETETLRVISSYQKDTSSSLLAQLELTNRDEVALRERLHYSDVVEHGYPHKSDLATAKKALGVDDLSQFNKGSDEYLTARTMLTIIMQDKKSQEGRNYESVHHGVRESSLTELGKIMMEYPARSDAISGYISDRGLLIREIEHWHLREYLDTPAPALSEGLL
jgi:hypothetical protein